MAHGAVPELIQREPAFPPAVANGQLGSIPVGERASAYRRNA
jgi:hypothetical protein